LKDWHVWKVTVTFATRWQELAYPTKYLSKYWTVLQ